jgi:hypothetical protein
VVTEAVVLFYDGGEDGGSGILGIFSDEEKMQDAMKEYCRHLPSGKPLLGELIMVRVPVDELNRSGWWQLV